MFCPRCGAPNPDTTKFCRQCGLGLQPVTGYVASGGTAQLPQQSPAPSNPLAKVTEGLTPKQKLILTILLLAFSPAIFGTFGAVTGLGDLGGALAGISSILMPIGIVFAIMRYKAQKRQLAQAMMYPPAMPMHPAQQQMPPAAQYSLPQPAQQPIQHPAQHPGQQPAQQPRQPVYQPPVAPSPSPTNPLGPSSVTEDETRRLPGQG